MALVSEHKRVANMYKQGIVVSVLALALSASSAYAATVYSGPQLFVAAQASNEASIVRSANLIITPAGSVGDFDVLASPPSVDPAGIQTVSVKGFNSAGFNTGSCTVYSISPSGGFTSSFSQNLVAGNWTVSIPFTPAQAPAGNAFTVRCTLLANGRNRIYGVSVSSP